MEYDEEDIIELISDEIRFNSGVGMEELFVIVKNTLVDANGIDIDDDTIRKKIDEAFDTMEKQSEAEIVEHENNEVEDNFDEMYDKVDDEFIKKSLMFIAEDMGKTDDFDGYENELNDIMFNKVKYLNGEEIYPHAENNKKAGELSDNNDSAFYDVTKIIIKILDKGGYGNVSNVLNKVRNEKDAESQPTIDKLVNRVKKGMKLGILQKQWKDLDEEIKAVLDFDDPIVE